MASKPKQETPVTQRIPPEKVLYKWKAPSRPFKKRDREFWVTVISIAGVAGFILFLVEGIMPVMLIISLIFLFYILTTVEPEEVEYAITDRGIKITDTRTSWDDVTRFWFTSRFKNRLLVFETFSLVGRMELVIDKKNEKDLKKVISKYVLEEKSAPSGLDRASDFFAKKLPQ